MKKNKQNIIILFLLFTCISCRKEVNVNNLNNGKIAVIGHGGMGISDIYPLNSSEGILCCLNKNSDGVELDVEMTKDSILVAIHDAELSESTTGTGRIYNKTWEEVKTIYYKDPLYAKYSLMRLDEFFKNLKADQKAKTFYFDCKNQNPDISYNTLNSFFNKLTQLINANNLSSHCVIELRRPESIEIFINKRPDLKILDFTSDFNLGLQTSLKYNLHGISIDHSLITKEQVEQAHQKNLWISVFNCNTKSKHSDAINKNVDMILTDQLDYAVKVLK